MRREQILKSFTIEDIYNPATLASIKEALQNADKEEECCDSPEEHESRSLPKCAMCGDTEEKLAPLDEKWFCRGCYSEIADDYMRDYREETEARRS